MKRIIIYAVMFLISVSTLSLKAQVVADFTANNTAACSPLVVQFTDNSQGNISSWHWNFGNGNTSTQQNPGAIYIQPGMYNVTLVVSDGNVSDTIVKTDFITVYHPPQAELTVDAISGCAPLTVNFQDLSTTGSGNIQNWAWNFSDGGDSYVQNPQYTFTQAGSYDVTLMVFDVNGCQNSVTYYDYITVNPEPVADFVSDINNSCITPLSVNFTNLSVGNNLTYSWDFGNGQTSTNENPSITYNQQGNYTVNLSITDVDGCVSTISKNNFINIEEFEADFESDLTSVCINETVSFTNLSNLPTSSVFWDFGNGETSTAQNPQVVYDMPGTYTVSLVATTPGGCIDTIVQSNYIEVSAPQNINIIASDIYSCQTPLTVNFSSTAASSSLLNWNFGDGNTSNLDNPIHTYTEYGEFDISLEVTNPNGCDVIVNYDTPIVIIAPEGDFVADTTMGCLPLEVSFTSSTNALPAITGWEWDFGDGNTSTDEHPVHTYTVEGIFHVSLIIANDNGCSDTIVKENYVRAGNQPTADFEATPLVSCINSPISFTNLSDSANIYFWGFGDGGFSNVPEPVYTYSDTGYFDVTLIALNNGCPDTLILEDYIYIYPPLADFSYTLNCTDPYTVVFTDNSLGPDSWNWSFGDGNVSTDINPIHTFAETGTYTVTLETGHAPSSCLDQISFNITIADPIADFYSAVPEGCAPFQFDLEDDSQDAVSWLWLVDGMTSTQQNPQFTISTPGSYDVKLIIEDINGCKDTIVKTEYIIVNGPTTDFLANQTQGCAPLVVQFQDNSTTYMGNITQWGWDFGDGNTASGPFPLHTYQQSGNYTVSMTVVDDNGCTQTITKNQFIEATYPEPNFIFDNTSCTSAPVTFQNTSNGTGMSYFWDFGDGNTSTDTNPTHLYVNEGVYTVALTVTDVNGCDSTLVLPNAISISNPIASFVADSTFSPCPPLLVNFQDQSFGDIAEWNWDFGDGKTSNLENPTHVYLTPGNFDVTLIVTSVHGCKDTMYIPDHTLVLGPNGTFDFNPQVGCTDFVVDFTSTTTNTVSWTWDFGDGTVIYDTDSAIQHTYQSVGNYSPVMILDDGLGCLFSVETNDTVKTGSLTSDFAASTDYVCKEGEVHFGSIVQSSHAQIDYFWDFGDGNTSTDTNPINFYNIPGIYTVSLIVDNGFCIDTIIKSNLIEVDQGPDVSFIASDTASCDPMLVQFQDQTTSTYAIQSWEWDFDNGITDSIPNPQVFFSDTGIYNVSLTVTSETGCSNTEFMEIIIHSLPVAYAGNDEQICFGDSIELNGNGGVSYIWTSTGAMSNPTIQNPLAFPQQSSTYHLTVTDQNGCQSSTHVNVIVMPLPTISISQDTSMCLGEIVELTVDGANSYSWTQSASLDCDDCAKVLASPSSTTTYVVEGTDLNGCKMSDSVTVNVNPIPEGIITPNQTICFGENVEIEAVGGITYNWQNTNDLSCAGCSNPIASPQVSTQYFLETINEFGCSSITDIAIAVNPLPEATLISDTAICYGETIELTVSGGTSYQWDTTSIGLSCFDCDNPIVTPNETAVYQVEVFNQFNCSVIKEVEVIVNQNPYVNIASGATICAGEIFIPSIDFSNDVTNWSWNPNNFVIDNGIQHTGLNPDSSMIFEIEVKNEFNCSATDSVYIEVINSISVDATSSFDVCEGELVDLEAVLTQFSDLSDVAFTWTDANGSIISNNEYITVKAEDVKEYTLIVEGGTCIPDTVIYEVTANPLPQVNAGEDKYVVSGTQIKLEAVSDSENVSFAWSNNHLWSCEGCNGDWVTVDVQTNYTVTAINEFGCKTEDSKTIKVIENCGGDIFIPNTFTPDGNEINDVLYVRTLAVDRINFFRVYDRWGKIVFETNDLHKGWDGRMNGVMMNSGVFVYQLEAVCTNGLIIQKEGNVTLIR